MLPWGVLEYWTRAADQHILIICSNFFRGIVHAVSCKIVKHNPCFISACVTGLPGAFVNNKLGEKVTICISGSFMVVAMVATAFTNQAWQGILASGALYGEYAFRRHCLTCLL